MAEQEEINITKMLMDIKERLVRVETNTEHLHSTESKAEEALNIAKHNRDDITDLKESAKFTQRTSITAVLIPLGWLLIKYFGGF